MALLISFYALGKYLAWRGRDFKKWVRFPRQFGGLAKVDRVGVYACVCRKLDSAILVVKATEDRLRCDGAETLNRAMGSLFGTWLGQWFSGYNRALSIVFAALVVTVGLYVVGSALAAS